MNKTDDILNSFGEIKGMANWNPNVAEDLQKYVFPEFNKAELEIKLQELKNKSSKKYEKVIRYLEVVELIHHMRVIYEEAKLQHYKFHGEEIVGIAADIDALNLYLVLAAMDVITPKGFAPFEEWITSEKNLKNFGDFSSIQEFMNSKYKEYKDECGMTKGVGGVYSDMTFEFMLKMVQNTALIKIASLSDIKNKLSAYNFTDNIIEQYNAVMEYCFSFRNKYTHEMNKVSKPPYSDTNSIIVCKADDAMRLMDSHNTKEVNVLIVRKGYNLEDALLEISVHCCRKKYFGEE